MVNDIILERLGWQRLQEELRLAEYQRLVREAQGPRGSLWARVTRMLAGGGAPTDDGGRIPPDASRAGEMPGL